MVIGIEIGGTKLQLALGYPNGMIVKTIRGAVSLKDGHSGILHWIQTQLSKLLSELNVSGIQIDAIGVGFGGPIDSKAGIVIKSVQVPGWDDFNLKKWFEDTFSIPTYLFNDSSAAGWGEYILGSGIGTKQFFYTNIGSGIGGALVLNGILFDGQGYGAGELGQVRIADWTTNIGGKDQKLEALCSGWAIESRLRNPGYVPEESLLMELCEDDCSKLTCAMLGVAVVKKDAFAMSELEKVATGISMAIANVLCLFQPERIAIGGGVSLIGDPLIHRIQKEVEKRQFISNQDHYTIVQCELGEAIVLQGAMLLAMQALYKEGK